MNNKKKALGIAEGLKLLSFDAISLYAADGAVLVELQDFHLLDEKTENQLRSMGWFIDAYTGFWCFCV